MKIDLQFNRILGHLEGFRECDCFLTNWELLFLNVWLCDHVSKYYLKEAEIDDIVEI